MLSKYYKRITAILLSFVLLTAVGCGEKPNGKNRSSKKEKDSSVYSESSGESSENNTESDETSDSSTQSGVIDMNRSLPYSDSKAETAGTDTIDYTVGTKPAKRATKINGFVRRAGKWIIDEAGDEWFVKGGGIDCGSLAGKLKPNYDYCNENLYKEHAALGCNTIRLTFNWEIFFKGTNANRFNDDGFDFIAKNVEWAKKYGIRIILNMHRIPGVAVGVTKDPEIFWSKTYQNRWIVAWREIARRFSNEPVILGYSFWNEQCAPLEDSQKESEKVYGELYQKCIDAVRTVDKKHMIICEQVFGRKNEYGQYGDTVFPAFPALKEQNIMYEFHEYAPLDYTYQGDSKKYGIVYGDPNYISYSGLTQLTDNFPSLSKSGNQINGDWKEISSDLFTVTGKNTVAGSAIFKINGSVSGSSALDIKSVSVYEFDASGNKTGTVYQRTFNNNDSIKNYFNYNGAAVSFSDGIGMTLSNSGVNTLIQNDAGEFFKLKEGYKYQAVAKVKGRSLDESVKICIGIRFWESKEYGKAFTLCKESLEIPFKRYLNYREKNNVPVFCGEWGAYYKAYDQGLNAEQWADDMLNIFKENDLYFCIHSPYGMYSKKIQPWHYEGTNPTFNDIEYTAVEDAFRRILPTI